METSLESKILDELYTCFNRQPGHPVTLSELIEAIGTSDIGKVWQELKRLQEKGWVKYQILEDGTAGTFEVTSDGCTIARDRQKTVAYPQRDRVNTACSCPTTIGDLIQKKPDCASLIQRDDIVHEIQKYFTQRPPPKLNYVVLYGQPMVGKTLILRRLCEVLGGEYVTLMVTGQGISASNQDDYLFDLAFQLKIQFDQWTKRRGLSLSLDAPEREDFRKGRGRNAFFVYWNNLRHTADNIQPVVMFDEIEHLLDDPRHLDEQIIAFLDTFVSDPDNGYFVLAGSERISHSSNKRFSDLIGDGYSVRVPYFDKEDVESFFTALQDYFVLEDDALKCVVALCDGQPRVLQNMFEVIASLASKLPGKREVGNSDVKLIEKGILERTDNFIWALVQRLHREERGVVTLFSQKPCDLNDLGCRLRQLFEQADQHLQSKLNYKSLEDGTDYLKTREWIDWINRDERFFNFRLGIVRLWLSHNILSSEWIEETSQ